MGPTGPVQTFSLETPKPVQTCSHIYQQAGGWPSTERPYFFILYFGYFVSRVYLTHTNHGIFAGQQRRC